MLPFHPLANLFPMIEDDKFDELVSDIKANGLREEIVLFDGQILDGRNRYRAGMLADIVPVDGLGECFRQFDGERDGDPLAFVLSKNLSRRHLNDDQRRMVAARLVTMGRGRPSLDKPAECGIKVSDAAALANTDAAGTERARTVETRGTPELKAAVDRGKLSVNAAHQATKLPPEAQREIAKQAEAGKANVVRTAIKKGVRNEREKELGARQQAFPEKKYGIILADPEWEHKAWNPLTGIDRSAVQHYPVSDEKVISARNVQKISDRDCILFLWCVDPARGVRAFEAWGFEYKTYFVWAKDIVPDGPKAYKEVGPVGMGYWKRDRCELLLVGTRGKVPAPAPGTQSESIFFAPRPKIEGTSRIKHSAKPEVVHEWIERHFPTMPKIELNARMARPGWDAWGLEAPQHVQPEDENQDRFEEQFNQDESGANSGEPAEAAIGTADDDPDSRLADGRTSAGSASLTDAPAKAGCSQGLTGGESATSAFDADRDLPEFMRLSKDDKR